MSGRILVIDDEPTVRTVIRVLLEARGFELDLPAVEHRSEAMAASRAARSGCYDAILLDLKVPFLDPVDLVERMTTGPVNTPTVIIAGFLHPELLQRLSALGVQHFLQKPFGSADLVAAVRGAVASRRTEPSLL
jgi:CheY-like chemotaxis protein